MDLFARIPHLVSWVVFLPALGALERAGYLASDATGRLLRTGLAAPAREAGGGSL